MSARGGNGQRSSHDGLRSLRFLARAVGLLQRAVHGVASRDRPGRRCGHRDPARLVGPPVRGLHRHPPPQPTTVDVVCTTSCHSPATTSAARTSSRPGQAAWKLSHYCVDPPGASLQTSSIRKLCEVPGAVLTAPTSPSGVHRPTLHDEEPVYRNNVEIACTNVVSTNLSGGAALGASVLVQAAALGEYLNYRDKVLRKQGTGSPEGVVTAGVGSVSHRRDGSGGTTLYVKESGSGNSGWVAYGSGASLPQCGCGPACTTRSLRDP